MPDWINGDPHRLRQVLANLLGNAVKFTQVGEVVVNVSLQPVAAGAALHFSVRDTGIGMSESEMAGLFQPFSQADSSTTRKFGGSGLGLVIARQIVSAMVGELELRSAKGVGTCATITLPMRPARTTTDSATAAPEALRNLRVLVVDDNDCNRMILEAQLQHWQMQVTAVPDGEAALRELDRAAQTHAGYVVAVLDYQMPNMDGVELARRIRADARFDDLRLVMLTSGGVRGDAERAFAAGMNAFLSKPVRQSELLGCLLTALQATEGSDAGVQPAVLETGNAQRGAVLAHHAPSSALAASTGHAPELMPVVADVGLLSARVLLVEDSPVNLEIAQLMLAALGCTVETAQNGVQAVAAVAQAAAARGGFDLVLMDCQMPEMDGYVATRSIRELQVGGLAQLPIVALTANALAEDRDACLAAGMNDYLAKPFSQAQLEAALRRNLISR